MRTLLAEEIAQILRVPRGRVYKLVRQGMLPAIRIGRQARFREETIVAWLAQFEKDSITPPAIAQDPLCYVRDRST